MTTAKKAVRTTVADYITLQVEASPKAQYEIAKEVGFDKPNMITMIKQGKTKLPLTKIGPMARALGVDPIFLFRLVMSEYMPETWEAIEALSTQPTLTKNEIAVVEAMREAGVGGNELTGDQKRDLAKHIKVLVGN